MEIKQYEVMINEKNGTCGFVINLNFYPLEDFLQSDLKYEVLSKERKVRVFNEQNEVIFLNLTDELIYYAYKTLSLVILGGTEENNGEIKIVSEAHLI